MAVPRVVAGLTEAGNMQRSVCLKCGMVIAFLAYNRQGKPIWLHQGSGGRVGSFTPEEFALMQSCKCLGNPSPQLVLE